MTANRQQTSRGNSSSALDLKEYLGLLGNDKLIPQLPRFHIQIANNVEPF